MCFLPLNVGPEIVPTGNRRTSMAEDVVVVVGTLSNVTITIARIEEEVATEEVGMVAI